MINKISRIDYPLFFLFGTVINFSSRTVAQAQENLFSTENITRIVCLSVAFILISFYMIKTRAIERLHISIPIFCLFLFWLEGILSFVFCEWMSYGLLKWIEYFVILLGACYISCLDRKIPGYALRSYEMMKIFLEVLIASVMIGALIDPERALYSGENEYSALRDAVLPFILRGWIISITSTSVGMISAILLFDRIIKILDEGAHFNDVVKLCVFSGCVITAQSRTAIIGLSIALVFLVICSRMSKKIKIFFVAFGITILLIFSQDLFSFLLRGQEGEVLASFSGRTVWWEYAWNFFKQSNGYIKLFGNGFAAGEKIIAARSNAVMYTLDSEYFAILISNGLFGLFCYGLFWIKTFQKIRIKIKQDRRENKKFGLGIEVLGVSIIILCRTFTVTSLALHTYYLLIMVFLLCAIDGKAKSFQRRNFNEY